MATTLASLVTAVSGLPVSSVTRQYTEPPLSLNTADMPVSWPQLPNGADGATNSATFCDVGGWPEYNINFIVAFEAVGQSRQIENYSGCVALFDEIQTVLRSAKLGASKHSWQSSIEIVTVADISYWAIVNNITTRG